MRAEDFVAKTKDLPAVSPAAGKLVTLLNQTETDMDLVVMAIRSDASLSAKLLKVCNSSYYASGDVVTSVEESVMRLGYQEIYRIVVALCFGGVLDSPLHGFGIEETEMWRHSLTTALAAEALAVRSRPFSANKNLAYTCGLLHDIGKVVLNRALNPELRDQIRILIAEKKMPRDEAERTALGADHAQVGACLLQKWKLPRSIVDAVADHHRPVVKPAVTLSAIVHLADAVAHQLGSAPGWDSFACRFSEDLLQALGISTEDYQSSLISVLDDSHRIERAMTLP